MNRSAEDSLSIYNRNSATDAGLSSGLSVKPSHMIIPNQTRVSASYVRAP